MAESDKLLSSAKAALQAGRKQTARRLLSGIVAAEPANELAWLYLAAASSHDEAVEALTQILSLNPDHAQASQQWQRLNADPAALVELEPEAAAVVSQSAPATPKPAARTRKPRTSKPKPTITAAADSEVETAALPETLVYTAEPEPAPPTPISQISRPVEAEATEPPAVPLQLEAATVPEAVASLAPEVPAEPVSETVVEKTVEAASEKSAEPATEATDEKLVNPPPNSQELARPRLTLPIQTPALVTFKPVDQPTATSGTRSLPTSPAPYFRARTRLKSRPVRRNGRIKSRTNLTGFGLLILLLVVALVGYLVYISFF